MRRKSKYSARKVIYDGMTFDSKKEARRWKQLLEMQNAGEISDLSRQVKFVLIPSQRENGKVIERECAYYADFVYVDKLTDKTVVEDTKGYRTTDYIIKRKLMLERFGIQIKEV